MDLDCPNNVTWYMLVRPVGDAADYVGQWGGNRNFFYSMDATEQICTVYRCEGTFMFAYPVEELFSSYNVSCGCLALYTLCWADDQFFCLRKSGRETVIR